MTVSLVTAPAAEPLVLADAKAQARVGSATDEDDLVGAYIKAARDRVERYTRTKLITQTWRITLDGFPPAIEIPLWPVQSINKITYTDQDGTEQTLASSKYRLVTSRRPNVIAPAYLEVWPVTRVDFDAVKADVVVGYGAAGSGVPPNVLHAMRLLIADMFDVRSDHVEIPRRAEHLLDDHVFWV